MKYTVLQLVQSILSSMDSDEVNSITDTTEAYQIALLLQDLYYDLAVDLQLPETECFVNLIASADITRPLVLTLPENCSKIFSLKYNNQEPIDIHPWYREVTYIPFQEFFERLQGGILTDVSDSTIADQVYTDATGATYTFTYKKDKMPEWYTTIGSRTILFDSLDTSIDSVIQSSKIIAPGRMYPVFTVSDAFVPDLDASLFPYFRNKAKVRAFNEFKQVINQDAMSEARRQKIMVQTNRDRSEDYPKVFSVLSRYGRKNIVNPNFNGK